jgi:hypothetical protein
MHGLRQEVFPIILPATFHEEGLTFEQVSHFSKNFNAHPKKKIELSIKVECPQISMGERNPSTHNMLVLGMLCIASLHSH